MQQEFILGACDLVFTCNVEVNCDLQLLKVVVRFDYLLIVHRPLHINTKV